NAARARGAGSCIFLHVWRDAASPTVGCTAMAKPALAELLAWLDPDALLVVLPEPVLRRLPDLPQVAQTLAARPDLIDAATLVPGLQVELRYATRDNFLGEAVYGELAVCYLARDAAAMLARAAAVLAAAHPDLRLHVWDCARPASVQRKMWAIVKGTPAQPYVADPAKGSIHSFGCAVDITVATAAGAPPALGTPHHL